MICRSGKLWATVAFVLLLLGLQCFVPAAEPHDADSSDDSSGDSSGETHLKKVHEEEDEIGFIQTLLIHPNPIASLQSEYQTIEVYESNHFGKVFLLDENLQLTERDAPHYNEMLAHVPMMEYLAVQQPDEGETINVLVIGGGDGYVVSELLKFPNVAIDHVDLDEGVIKVSKEHFEWSSAWEDERVNLVVGDGAAFVKKQVERKKKYHVIVQDASDPFWYDDKGEQTILPSHVLYDLKHFANIYALLQESNGVVMFQAETYNIPSNLKEIQKWKGSLEAIGFAGVRYGSIAIPTYSTGQIGFFVAHASNIGEKDMVCKSNDDGGVCGMDLSGGLIDWSLVSSQFEKLKGTTKYYHPRIHRSAFDLPFWVEEAIYVSKE
jgi:spermidine synthase